MGEVWVLFLELYTGCILGVTGFIQDMTGLYPVEQLSIARVYLGLSESAGVADTLLYAGGSS